MVIHQESCEKYKISLVRHEYETRIDQYKKEHEKEIDKLNETIFDLKRNHDKDIKFLIDRFDYEKILLEKQIERIERNKICCSN